jgi:hypothetical protein
MPHGKHGYGGVVEVFLRLLPIANPSFRAAAALVRVAEAL